MTALARACYGAALIALTLSSCQTPPVDRLTHITRRGTLIIATDAAYPPQSEVIAGEARLATTRCANDQYTANQLRGFDVAVAQAIARELNVEACFVTPAWDIVLVGAWQDQWDVHVGSMAITTDRLQRFIFTQPYYTTPLAVFIHRDNAGTLSRVAQLRGQPVAVCGGCTSEAYLNNTLDLLGVAPVSAIENPIIRAYYGDMEALAALANKEVQAALTPLLTGQQAASRGAPVIQLSAPVYYEYNALALDRASATPQSALLAELNAIITRLHANGALKALSQRFFEADVASPAAGFVPPAP